MRRTAMAVAALLFAAACTSVTQDPPAAPVDGAAGFPLTITADNGEVTVEARPERIVSLSAVATEMLFAIEAGPQVVAVDDQSNYPEEAPLTDLSGITPNLEAILAYDPDLVVISFDPGDVVDGLNTAGVPVLSYTAAATIEDVYRQIAALGSATGNTDQAEKTIAEVKAGLAAAVSGVGSLGEGVTYYHEIDALLYTATSDTFFGEIYGLFGLSNIADPADEDGAAFGYPQLTSEFIVSADPDIIFLANTLYGESKETVSARPGWSSMTAVANGAIVELDSDIASRWGPRIVDFAEAVARALEEHFEA